MLMERMAPARTQRRRRVHWSFVIAGAAIVLAIIYLVVANTGATAEYYMTIGQLRSCTRCGAQTVRVAGIVANNSVVRETSTNTVHFVITEGAQTLPVVYGGVVPDIFRPGVQVVVEGHVTSGVFHAQNLLTKCPSRYQPTPPSGGSLISGTAGN